MTSPLGVVTAAEAVLAIKPGQRVYLGSNCGMPQSLLEALVARTDLSGVEIVHGLTFGPAPHATVEASKRFRTKVFFTGSNVREAVRSRRAEFVPIFLSEIPKLVRSGRLPLDVALVQVSPPDSEGLCSLGVAVDFNSAAVECAGLVIAEVNPRMPRTCGKTLVHKSRFHALVHVDRPLPEGKPAPPDETSDLIGRNIAALVPDGATIQMGIGAIPDAVLRNLGGAKDLGVHTEMFSDGLIPLVKSGVVNGSRKTIDRGKTIVTFAVGSAELYGFVDRNPDVEFQPIEYVNDPFVIAQNDSVVAINSAIAVDLSGQVCADTVGGRIYSGIGGQVDFIRGAARSKGGVPIIALPSVATLPDGSRVSRIVPVLEPGAGVVTSRGDVHWVVTEWGLADLFGKSLHERARALTAIAHPDFREGLAAAAR